MPTEKLSPQLLEPVYHSQELIVQGFIKFNRSVADKELTSGTTLQRLTSLAGAGGSVPGSGSSTATTTGGIGSPEKGFNIRNWNIVVRQCSLFFKKKPLS